MNKTRISKKCAVCPAIFYCRPSENIVGARHYKKYCSKKCYLARPLMRPKIDGKSISTDGYFVIWIEGKVYKEHRLLMENYLGRKLKSNEIVHHKDHDKLNNSISNLEITTRTEHNIHHFKKYNDGLTNIQRFRLNNPDSNKIYKQRAKEKRLAS